MARLLDFIPIKADLLVIGGGLAGCWAAIKVKEHLAKVVLADKGYLGKSGQTVFAGAPQFPRKISAGYINICSLEDDPGQWLKEIVEEGDYLNDQEWVKIQLAEGFEQVAELEKLAGGSGPGFLLRDNDGRPVRRKISTNIYTVTNVIDALSMMEALRKKVLREKINVLQRVMVTDLVVQDGKVFGALGFDYRRGRVYLFQAPAVIMAAAGCGFKSFLPGHANLTGDGQAMAFRAGAILRNMEHTVSVPTAKAVDSLPLWVASSLGARFLNGKGQEYMERYDPVQGNRARLARVIMCMAQEIKEGNGPIFFDLTVLKDEARALLKTRLPETLKILAQAGIDPFKAPIEYIPAFMGTNSSSGGIDIDTGCATNIPGLFAAGDSTCCPVQGTWSVLGVNLAFCLVSGARAARSAVEYLKGGRVSERPREIEKAAEPLIEKIVTPVKRPGSLTPDEVTFAIQQLIMPYDVCYIRTATRLEKALMELEEIKQNHLPRLGVSDPHHLAKALEVPNMLTVAELMLRSALVREESRGLHYREDFPLTDNLHWLKWVKVKKGKGKEIEVWAEPFPTPYVEPARTTHEPR